MLICSENDVAEAWSHMFQITEKSLSPDLHAVLSTRATTPNAIDGETIRKSAVPQPTWPFATDTGLTSLAMERAKGASDMATMLQR